MFRGLLSLRTHQFPFKTATFVVLAAVAGLLSGCGERSSGDQPGRPGSGSPSAARQGQQTSGGHITYPPVTRDTAASVKANELGQVMVLEYHNIIDKKGQFNQSAAQLRNDLQMLYDNGFQTLDMHDYLSGNITTDAGKTPVVLTFDDASKSQFRYLTAEGTPEIDPNCAVGILDAFAASHPGFGNHATFFVLPNGFSQPQYKSDKYRYLASHGYTLGNHTWTHTAMTHLSGARIQEELGKDAADIDSILPDYTVDVLAYPDGSRPMTDHKPDYTYVKHGSWKGNPYQIQAAFLVGAEPARSPYDRKLKPYAIPRVQAIEPDVVRWIKLFRAHPRLRFISDGNPDVVSIPAPESPGLNPVAVGSRHMVTW